MKRVISVLAGTVSLGALLAEAERRPRAADSVRLAIADGKLPAGYRDWWLISVTPEERDLEDIRAVLGNDAPTAVLEA